MAVETHEASEGKKFSVNNGNDPNVKPPPRPTEHRGSSNLKVDNLKRQRNPTLENEPVSGQRRKINDRRNLNAKDDKSRFGRLDPNNPEHGRRIQRRLKDISFGKNTIGYDEYTKQVPKHKRKASSMECPSTPDPMQDIPSRRWSGLVKAWRRALHKYDPPDLLQDNPAPKAVKNNDLHTSPNRKKIKVRSIIDEQIKEATELCLPVQFHESSSDTQHQSDCAENGNDCWQHSEEFDHSQHRSDDLTVESDDDLL